jgi:phosphohistidine phosphatase
MGKPPRSAANLWVIRHAKSSWADPGQADFDRPLNARGVKDGKRMIRWMGKQKQRPQWIFASDAARARATAEFVRDGYAVPPDQLLFDHRIYEASMDTLLDVLHSIPPDCPSVALVGHNPGSSEFVNAMVGKPVIDDLPTFGIAMLSLPPRWLDAQFGCAEFVALHIPKFLDD